MKAVYIFLVLLIAALISGCVDKKEQNITSSTPADFQNISSSTSAEILPENYVSEVEGNLTKIESLINEKEEIFSTEVSDSAFS